MTGKKVITKSKRKNLSALNKPVKKAPKHMDSDEDGMCFHVFCSSYLLFVLCWEVSDVMPFDVNHYIMDGVGRFDKLSYFKLFLRSIDNWQPSKPKAKSTATTSATVAKPPAFVPVVKAEAVGCILKFSLEISIY